MHLSPYFQQLPGDSVGFSVKAKIRGSLVVETCCFRCRGCGFHPCLGTKMSDAPGYVHSCSVLSDPLQLHGTRQAPLSMEFPRQEYWSGLPFPTSGHLPNPGTEPVSLCISCFSRQIIYHCTIWEDTACPWSGLENQTIAIKPKNEASVPVYDFSVVPSPQLLYFPCQ